MALFEAITRVQKPVLALQTSFGVLNPGYGHLTSRSLSVGSHMFFYKLNNTCLVVKENIVRKTVCVRVCYQTVSKVCQARQCALG